MFNRFVNNVFNKLKKSRNQSINYISSLLYEQNKQRKGEKE